MLLYKNIIVFKIITLLVLIFFTGCVTSKIEYVEKEKLPKDKVYRISDVYLNNGTVINLKDKEPKIKLKYKGMDNVIVYYEDVNIEKYVQLKDISSLKIEVLESNQLLTAVVVVGSLAIIVLLAFMITLTSGKFNIAG